MDSTRITAENTSNHGLKTPDVSSADQQKIQSLEIQVAQLKRQLAWFQREVFGQKSERREGDGNPLQLSLGDELNPREEDSKNEETETIRYERKKSSRKKNLDDSVNDSGLRFTDEVEVKEIRLSVPELMGENAEDYEIISEKITCRLAARPSSYVVLKYIQPVVKFVGKPKTSSDHDSTIDKVVNSTQPLSQSSLFSPAMPSSVINKSYADVSFIAIAMIDKWVYHLPFHRQQQRLQQNGITLCSGYLVQLMQRVVPLLKPVYEALLRSILQSKVLAMDEVPTKAGHRKKNKSKNTKTTHKNQLASGQMKVGYYWPIYGDRNEIVFPFAPTRSGRVVVELLKGFEGTLLSDGYSAYESFAKANKAVTLAQCWAHSRRKFVEVEDLVPVQANIALETIRAIYVHEEKIRDDHLTGKVKQEYRQKYSQPLVDTFFRWVKIETTRIALMPPDDYSKALYYVAKRETELRVFLDDADVQIDTNHIERALRVIPMGKKNWLFNWTESGAEAAGIIQSLLVSCKLQGINPYEYLVDVLQRIDQHPASKVDELIPRLWKQKFSESILRSPLWELDH